jgi:hypothetical protein
MIDNNKLIIGLVNLSNVDGIINVMNQLFNQKSGVEIDVVAQKKGFIVDI